VTIEDDVRTMLRERAAAARPSDDGWRQITARLDANGPVIAPAASRRPIRALAAASVAAAVLVGAVVVGGSGDTPTTQVVTPATVDDAAPPHIWAAPKGMGLEEAAAEFVAVRVKEGDVPVIAESTFDGHATARATGRGVETELALRVVDGRWYVIAATSDLVPIHGARYDGRTFAADVVAEIPGQLDLLVRAVDEDDATEGFTGVFSEQVQPRQEVPVHHDRGGEPGIGLLAKLVAADGTIAYSEVWVQPEADPAVPTGRIVSLWPATDADGLDALQQQADGGERADLLDPQLVARNYIDELVRPGDLEIGELEPTVDPSTSWINYQLPDGHGSVLLRRHGGERGIWYVIGATADIVEIASARTSATGDALDVQIFVGRPRTTVETTAWVDGRSPVRHTSGTTDNRSPLELRLVDAQDARWLTVVVRDGDAILGIAARQVD
jgi:hypothetical protein